MSMTFDELLDGLEHSSLNRSQFKEAHFAYLVRDCGLPDPVYDQTFHPSRRWRFDFQWPDRMVAVEIEGGIWHVGGGGHNRGRGYQDDLDKYNAAVVLGWRVLRFTPEDVERKWPEVLEMLRGLLTQSPPVQTIDP